jgi:hypothetical protein
MDHHLGHAAHFLQRVDRLNTQHAELALGLYRDHELLHVLLQRVTLPEGADRVAISLCDRTEGPYVIVNRQGRFITCLAQGMHVFGTPIVKRAQLDDIASHVDALRVLVQRAKAGGTAERDRHMNKVLFGRGNVTREEFDDLVSWAPLLYGHYVTLSFEVAKLNRQARQRLLLAKRIGPRDDRALRIYCETAWALMHLSSLLATQPAELIKRFAAAESVGSAQVRTFFSHEMMSLTTWPGMLRGAMFGAWVGDLVLPAFAEDLAQMKTFRGSLHGLFTVYAAYRRNPAARTDMLTELKRIAAKGESVPVEYAVAGLAEAMLEGGDSDDLAARLSLPVARRLIAQAHPKEVEERLAAMPDSDKRALLLGDPRALSFEPQAMFELLQCLVKASTLEPRDFYVSSAHRVRQAWCVEEGRRWIGPQLENDLVRKPMPIRRAAVPSRNEHCLCGSGRKHKHCCGNAGAYRASA